EILRDTIPIRRPEVGKNPERARLSFSEPPALRDRRAPAKWFQPLGNRLRGSRPHESQIRAVSPDAASLRRPLFGRPGATQTQALRSMSPTTAERCRLRARRRRRLPIADRGHPDSIAQALATPARKQGGRR